MLTIAKDFLLPMASDLSSLQSPASPKFAHLSPESRLVQLRSGLRASVSLPFFLSFPPVDRGLP